MKDLIELIKSTKTSTKNLTNKKFKYTYPIICVLIVAVISLILVISMDLNMAHTTLSASFSSIHDGNNPDGSPFDIYEVISDDVLERACEKLDHKIDPATLKKHISVTGITSDGTFNTIKQNVLDGDEAYSYFPSRYTLSYSIVSDSVKADGMKASIKAILGQIGKPSKEEILKAVTQSYKEYYEHEYVVSNEIFDIDWTNTKSLDYFNRVSEMKNVLSRISRYLEARYNDDAKFISKSGMSFGDLNAEASRLMDNDIKSFEAFIIQNGITTNKEKLLNQFEYVLHEENEETTRKRGEYSIMLDGIAMYDPSITKVVFVPSLDTDKNFYMNRTRIGIDYLTEKASKANIAGDTSENQAQYYEHLISQFRDTAAAEEWVMRTAELRCDEIIGKINEFTANAADINDEYLETVAYEGIETSEIAFGQDRVYYAVAVIKIAVVCASIFYAAWFVYSTFKKIQMLWKGETTDVD